MAIELIELTKNTRGQNSREIKYMAIGKWETRKVQKESKPAYNEDGTKKLDEKGNEVRIPLGKDADGKLITIEEEVQDFVTDGVLTKYEDALELVGYEEQLLLDCFVDGFNERQYAKEADKDELDEFLSTMALDDDQKAVFKRTARNLSRNYDTELLEAAEMVKKLMLRKQAKTQPVAATA